MINPGMLELLQYWVEERESIRLKKEAGEKKPWTTDPILQSFRFCNVRREDDKVTKWFAENWRDTLYQDEPNFIPAIILGRTINWPDTLEKIGFPRVWDRLAYQVRLQDLIDADEKVWTGAYMITAGPPGVTKAEWVTGNADVYFRDASYLRSMEGGTLEEAWRMLQEYPCVGPFIAGQVVADLKHTRVLTTASDWWDWAAVGPGSARGLNRLFDRPVKDKVGQQQGLEEMRLVREMAKLNALHLQDVQNCLCEFDKFMRVRLGEGRPRASYPGK